MAERYRRGFFFVIRKNCEITFAHSQNWQGFSCPKCTFRADSCAVFAIIKYFWRVGGVGTGCAILEGMKTRTQTNTEGETMKAATFSNGQKVTTKGNYNYASQLVADGEISHNFSATKDGARKLAEKTLTNISGAYCIHGSAADKAWFNRQSDEYKAEHVKRMNRVIESATIEIAELS